MRVIVADRSALNGHQKSVPIRAAAAAQFAAAAG